MYGESGGCDAGIWVDGLTDENGCLLWSGRESTRKGGWLMSQGNWSTGSVTDMQTETDTVWLGESPRGKEDI